MKTPEKSRGALKALLRLGIKLSVTALIVAALLIFVTGFYPCRTNAMYPAVRDGDLLVLYKLDSYRSGDVIVYRTPGSGENAVSRIAAEGGHVVEISSDAGFRVDGCIPGEEIFYPTEPLSESGVSYPYAVPENSVFVLDDYRVIGEDSREFGAVPKENIVGKAIFILRKRGI